MPDFYRIRKYERSIFRNGKKAKSLYGEYVKRGLKETPAFKGVGMEYINFAMKEARLFQLLFMREQPKKPTMETILPSIDENYEAILSSVKNSYNLSDEDSEKLYRHLWIYTHGIATLCATGMCAFTMEETGKMLTEVCIAILKDIKAEETK